MRDTDDKASNQRHVTGYEEDHDNSNDIVDNRLEPMTIAYSHPHGLTLVEDSCASRKARLELYQMHEIHHNVQISYQSICIPRQKPTETGEHYTRRYMARRTFLLTLVNARCERLSDHNIHCRKALVDDT